LGLQVVQIDVPVLVDFDEDGNASDRVDGSGNRGERIGVGQDFITVFQASGPQGDLHGLAPGGDGHAVLCTLIGGIIFLEH